MRNQRVTRQMLALLGVAGFGAGSLGGADAGDARKPVMIRGVPYAAVQAPLEVEAGGVPALAAGSAVMLSSPVSRTPFQCDPDATPALEPPLSFPGNIWGSPAMDPYVAQGQLLDQGCFSIIGCVNGIRLPAANPAPSAGPNWKVCGTIGNFQNSSSFVDPILFDALGGTGQPLAMTPASGCPSDPRPPATVQRDQDLIRFTVPPGGWENFRITFGAAVTYSAALYCNPDFPLPGTIDSCWTGQTPFPQEFGFSPIIGGELFSTSLPPQVNPVEPGPNRGDRDTVAVFPSTAPGVFLPEGEYIAMIRVVAPSDARWAQQGGPFPPNSPYQITVTATIPPPCGCATNLVDSPGQPGCTVNTADLAAFLGQFGKSCAQVPGPCADYNADDSVNTPDLVRLIGEFGRSSVSGVCQ